MKRRSASIVIVMAVGLAASSCGGRVPAVDVISSLTVLQEGLKGVSASIQQANDQTKDRVADVSARVEQNIKDIDNILTNQEERAKKDADDLMIRTFSQANETLFNASLAVEDANVDINYTVSNAIVNAAQLLRNAPLLHIRPFIAMVSPLVLPPGATEDYQVRLLGHFRPEWGLPEFTFEDGQESNGSMGADNVVRIGIPKALVNQSEGKRIKIKMRYPVDTRLFGHEWAQRDLWLTVLPKTVLTYRVLNATAIPDIAYDTPQMIRDGNTEAGVGDHVQRDITWSFHDLTGGYDFDRTYDSSKSSIGDARIIDGSVVGVNPQGQNGASVKFDSGKVVLTESAQGKGGNIFGNGSGANVYAKVAITLKLARRASPVSWHLKGNGSESGEISWGGNVVLQPDPLKDLSTLMFEIDDHTFDPPQQRILALNTPYNSKYVSVENAPQRVSITVRSLPRMQ